MKLVSMKTLLLAGAAGLISSPVVMAESSGEKASAAVAGSSALRVVRDKETGRVRSPNAEEMQEMIAAEQVQSSGTVTSAAPRIQTMANGAKSVILPPEYLVNLEATRDANGNIQTRHNQPGMDHDVSAALPTE